MNQSQNPLILSNYEIVKKVINDWDPMDLLALGGAEDEYSLEIKKIYKALRYCDELENLAVQIKKVMDASYSTDLAPIVCLQVADIIWEELR
ncbi:hypothetical protein FIU87_10760 [Bacillus sp. THAF10]|uniref:DUF1871 family protein n=1 Tax=Bacillus sp. THAF10 TaxID=2587848 RepID=UPI00126869C2|nr:DUF1871 family protein [Bacillus sp. THAF10]QFT89128.1 hypothetical protein FIU87_10760 [Bacillus sp. THAF10]